MEQRSSVDAKANWDPQQHYKSPEIAKKYDEERFSGLRGKLYIALERRALKRAFRDVPVGSTVVDMPCGTGRIAEFLLEQGYRVVGMDVSPAMLEVAQERLAGFGDRFTTQVSDAFGLTETKPAFDAVLCARVLMHFPVDRQAMFLRGVAGLTDGPIVFTQSLVTPYQRLRQCVKKVVGVRSEVLHPLTPDDLRTLLSAANLTLERKHWVAGAVSEAVVFVCRKRAS